MHPTLNEWIAEIRSEESIEVWCIDLPKDFHATASDWCSFLKQVLWMRQERLSGTTYAWHDPQAGQLRFNTIPGSINELPFRSTIKLVPEPEGIVEAWQNAAGYIPFSELELTEFAKPNEGWSENGLEVWAVEHTVRA